MKLRIFITVLLATSGILAQKAMPVADAQPAKSVPVPVEETFVSPYAENGLPADSMRSMLLDPELANKMKNNRQMWVGNIMRLGL
ncbi:MAG: hypothetical protein U1F27_13185 [Turneriella sp.]